jgi:polyphosphate kinase
VISALYSAAQAGVEIDLLIRGICCLRPGVPDVSDRIRVHATIDRFLEHARIFYFKNGGQEEVFCSSADWMPRNFRRRVEVMYPILDNTLQRRVVDEILGTMQNDNLKGWRLRPDGTYQRVKPTGSEPLRSQQRFMELARERARESESLLSLGSRQLLTAPQTRPSFETTRRKGRKKRRRGRGD